MKQFSHPCFVRVDDDDKLKELVYWLYDLGYLLGQASIDALDNTIVTYVTTFCTASFCQFEDIDKKGCTDCGTNIELFKAIAAINDEDDNMQWFVDKRTGEISTKCIGSFRYPLLAHTNYRKATPEEIFKHFKN